MTKWTVETLQETDWFAPLVEQVQAALERRTRQTTDERPALEAELRKIDEGLRGWSMSLARPDLPLAVRSCIEKDMDEATQRQNRLLLQISTLSADDRQRETVVDSQQIVDRLNRLDDVLAGNNPSRGNIELAQHIDSIRCFADGHVVVRTCKLGAFADAQTMLAEAVLKAADAEPRDDLVVPGKPRRLALRRLRGEDVDDEQVRTAADRATDFHRFASLGPEWFSEDVFAIPPPQQNWSELNALSVGQKRRETGWNHEKLAEFFNVSPHTICKAMAYARMKDPSFAQLPRKAPQIRWEDTHYQEVAAMHQNGMSRMELAAHFQRSLPLIRRALALAEQKRLAGLGLDASPRPSSSQSTIEQSNDLPLSEGVK